MKSLTKKYETKEVEIKNLRLDVDNSRWEGTAKNEKEAISKLIDVAGIPKMQNMINNFGERLSQDLPLLAIKIKGEPIVKDGNRRLFSLKYISGLIENPNFKRPNTKEITPNTKVEIHFYKNKEDLIEAIQTIHGGGEPGSGLMAFGTIEKQRINSKRTTERTALTVLDNANKRSGKDKINVNEIINFTNYERMLNSKEIKNYFGIKKEKGKVIYDISKDKEIIKLAKESKNIKVSDIYTANEAAKMAKSILKKETLPSMKKDEIQVDKTNSPKKSTKLKYYLINSSRSKIDTLPEFSKFIKALSKIQYKSQIEISGPLYRVLLDYSIRYYCDNNGINTTKIQKNKTADKPLWELLKPAIEHMQSNGLEKANGDRVLKELNSKDSHSLTSLNKVTHNYDYIFTFNELKDIKKIFDNIILFIIGK